MELRSLVEEPRTASAVAAEPNGGGTVSTALCTAECRGWPICLGLRLSAGSVFLYLLRLGVFVRGQTPLQPLSPGTSVACKRLPCVSVDG